MNVTGMVRGFLKTGIAYGLHFTGADLMLGALKGLTRMPLVVCYHRVVEQFDANARHSIPPMLVSRGMLERHLDWIGRQYRFVSLDELGARLEADESFKTPVAAVTFDDGYRDVYDNAFPLLKRKGIPAAVFVVADLVGTSRLQTYDRLYALLRSAFTTWRAPVSHLRALLGEMGVRLPELASSDQHSLSPLKAMAIILNALPQAVLGRFIEALMCDLPDEELSSEWLLPLGWETLSEMQSAGITIGSHSSTHALLTNESEERVIEETRGSRETLEQKLGITIKHFAYPGGFFDRSVVNAVAASGYRFAYTTCQHRDPVHPLLTLPRVILWQNSCLDALGRFSPAILSCQVNKVFDFPAGCRQDHVRSIDAPVSSPKGAKQTGSRKGVGS